MKQVNDKTAWLKYRAKFLFKNPLCARCNDFNLDTPASHIHQIEPTQGLDDILHWQPENHQALCGVCYSVKNKT